jgi:hypothetical protein
MSRPEIPVDVDVLRDEIRKTYSDVSTDQDQDFIFPTGRAWAQELGYPEPELSASPTPRSKASRAWRTIGSTARSSLDPSC